MFVYCLQPDKRDKDRRTLLVTSDISKAHKKARQYMIRKNKHFKLLTDETVLTLTDQEFCAVFITATGLMCPFVQKIKLS